jgi:iron(III) transport system permease protein
MAAVATINRIRGFKLEARLVLMMIVVGVIGFAVLLPLALMVLNTFKISQPSQPDVYSLSGWTRPFTTPGIPTALWNSAKVVVVQQAISFPIAILFAWLIARTQLPASKFLEFLFWIAFFIPTIPVIQAWILLAHPSAGLLNKLITTIPGIDSGPFNIFSFWGIIWVHLMTKAVAIKVMILTPAFRNMDASLEDASRVSGANALSTLIRITVPVMTPAIVVMLLLSLLFTFQSVEIELILGLRERFFVFGSKIFDLTRLEPPQYGQATSLGLVVAMFSLPLIYTQRWISTRRSYTTLSGRYQAQLVPLGRWKWAAFGTLLTFGLMITLVSLVFLVMGTFMKIFGFFDIPSGSWTLKWWFTVLGDPIFVRALKNTLILGLGSATLTTVVVTLVAYFIVRSRSRLAPIVDTLTWIPNALAGIVIALAWLWIFLQTPFLRPLFGTIWALIIVAGLSGLTLGVQIVKANVLQISKELEEASLVTGGGMFYTFRKIIIPLLIPTMMVVWIINFVLASGNAIMPALLSTPNSQPLAAVQLQNVLAGQNEAGSVVGLIVVIIALGVALAARAVGLRIRVG